MKKFKCLFILIIIFGCTFSNVQSKIIDITVQDFFFNPGVVNAHVGDTVRWTWLGSRLHSTTCDGSPGTVLPPGADSWNFFLDSNTPVFMYPLMVTGTYQYICIFHTVMTGTIIADAPLPVELIDFVATTIKNEVILDWSTGGEVNNELFEVQRVQLDNIIGDYDPDELPFLTIGILSGNGTSTNIHNYKFRDRNLNSGTYLYRLKQVDHNSNFIYHLLANEVVIGIPEKFNLSQNYPNPFNPTTKFNFDLPSDGSAEILIYSVSGKEVMRLNYDNVRAGYQTVEFEGSNLPSGMYYYRLNFFDGKEIYSRTKRMMLIK